MQEITVRQLQNFIQEGRDFNLIDIRENYEYDFGHLNCNHIHIPMDMIADKITTLDLQKDTFLMCKSGKRAAACANFLSVNLSIENIGIIKGGIEAYVNEIDSSIAI